MSDTNIVVIQGRLVRDPEVKFTNTGKSVLDISVASKRAWNDSQGQKKEEVTFVEVRLWGQSADFVGKWFHKGKPIIVTGSLVQEKWTDKATGKERTKTLVKADTFSFAGAGPKDASKSADSTNPTAVQAEDEVPY